MRDIVIRHSREGGNPVCRAAFWIPAFAGMTGFFDCTAQKVKNYIRFSKIRFLTFLRAAVRKRSTPDVAQKRFE